jgi:hypothetical protein
VVRKRGLVPEFMCVKGKAFLSACGKGWGIFFDFFVGLFWGCYFDFWRIFAV